MSSITVVESALASSLASSIEAKRRPVFAIHEISDLFVDACVQDGEGNLLFLSVYGRDTSLSQFYAALQLGTGDGGIRSFRIDSDPVRQVAVGNVDDLDKHHGRLPPTLFGALSQSFVFSKRVCAIDKANGSAVLLYPLAERSMTRSDVNLIDRKLWSLVCQLSPVALLDHWQVILLDACPGLSQSFADAAYPPIGNISGWRVQLPATFAELVSQLIRAGRLQLHPA
jgi:hypothetical protein